MAAVYRSKNSQSQTVLECTECGAETKIWRSNNRLKKNGHEKHMVCPNCSPDKKVMFHELSKMEQEQRAFERNMGWEPSLVFHNKN